MAYDNIMVFQGRFKEHILPDQIHILNVAFLVPEIKTEPNYDAALAALK